MKQFWSSLSIIIFLLALTACNLNDGNISKNESNNGNATISYMEASCSKDSVDEFMRILSEGESDGLSYEAKYNQEHCFNVTPASVSSQTDFQIFKFGDSCESFIMIDGSVYPICASFGGHGFVNAVPWDYNEDGNIDLLVASSWGSGMHRSQVSIFNTTTKESIIVYDTLTTDNPSVDLIVATSSTSVSLPEDQSPPYYVIYTADIEVISDLADLSYIATGVAGSVVIENEEPIFKPISSN